MSWHCTSKRWARILTLIFCTIIAMIFYPKFWVRVLILTPYEQLFRQVQISAAQVGTLLNIYSRITPPFIALLAAHPHYAHLSLRTLITSSNHPTP